MTLAPVPALDHPAEIPLEQITAENINSNLFYTPDEWAQIDFNAHMEYIQSISAEDREMAEKSLQFVLQRRFPDGQIISDMDRRQVIQECLTKMHTDGAMRAPMYVRDGQVKWMTVPKRVSDLLHEERRNPGIDVFAPKDVTPAKESSSLKSKLDPKSIGIGIALIALVVWMVSGFFQSPSKQRAAEATATAQAQATQLALNPEITLTPTPLALDNIDRPISEGDTDGNRYPTILEIIPTSGSQSRVFPIQQRAVEVAQWEFAEDPDVATSILGMSVRPVIGIPYSPNNQAFLEALIAGDSIRLRMSTGQDLQFSVSYSERVTREQDSIFSQQEPGIALVLLADPAPTRLVVYGSYSAGHETANGSLTYTTTSNNIASLMQPVVYGNTGITITSLETYTSTGTATAPLPGDKTYLMVDLKISATEDLDLTRLHPQLVDAQSNSYVPINVDQALAHYQLYSGAGILPGGQELIVTTAFLIPRSASWAALNMAVDGSQFGAQYALNFITPELLGTEYLQTQLLMLVTEGSTEKPGDLVVKFRVYNPTNQPITLTPASVYVIYSPAVLSSDEFPIGPSVQSKNSPLPITINPGESRDIEFRFQWSADPYVGLVIGGYQYVATLR